VELARAPRPTPFPYTTLFRSIDREELAGLEVDRLELPRRGRRRGVLLLPDDPRPVHDRVDFVAGRGVRQGDDVRRVGQVDEEDVPVAIGAPTLPDGVTAVGTWILLVQRREIGRAHV